jgi:hypothetical protein
VTAPKLTAAQRRALEMVAAAAKTRTGKAYVGKSTIAYDHLVRVNSIAVRHLESMGFVVSYRTDCDWNPGATDTVRLTPAGRAALEEK